MSPFPLHLASPGRFSLAEAILFVALAVASIALFWRRFSVVLGRIRASKKDPDFHLFPIGPRIRDFVWEVLLQGKVIRQRPLPGLAHALVFWAFCAFALVTLNHCAEALGVGFLDPRGAVGRFYFYLAALFAAACAVGIAALAIRRFIVRPRWLGDKLSWESGLIALLIFVLMVTYLAAFFVGDSTATVRALWWVHTLALLVFLPIVPHTKHLHLILSPFTVFLSRGGFSRIPPLVGDEDFGLVVGADLTRLVSLQAYSCVECGRCSEHCPATNTGKILNPKEIVLGVRGYLNDLGPGPQEGEGEPLLGRYNSQEAVFQCTTCGACEFQCPVGIEHLPILIGLRRGAVNTGAWEDQYGSKFFLALERGSNALGMSASERDKFIEKQALPIFDGTQEYCLWLGCMGAYDPRGREIIVALVRVLRHLGVSFGVLRKEKCTGDAARRLGNDLLFQQLAESNLQALAQAKVKKMLSICPHCVRTIQEDWKEYGAPPAIEHHSEFLARHLPNLNFDRVPQVSILRPGMEAEETQDRVPQVPRTWGPGNAQNLNGRDGKIVFHDPCYLGRYRGIYDQPRAVAALGGNLVEAPRHRERGFCCGAGGGQVFLGEEKGERVSHARAAELAATGAATVAAACPFCNTMLQDAFSAQGEGAPKLLDIAEIAARNLSPP
jgi:Fe-S oxidoreductase